MWYSPVVVDLWKCWRGFFFFFFVSFSFLFDLFVCLSTISSFKLIFRDDFGKMPYLTMCIKEAMRLHSPVPFIQRQLTQDTIIDGHTAPVGTYVDVIIYNIHHNPVVWEDSMVSICWREEDRQCLRESVWMCLCVCVCVCLCPCVTTFMYAFMSVFIHVLLHANVYPYVTGFMYAFMCVCVCVCVYVCAFMHVRADRLLYLFLHPFTIFSRWVRCVQNVYTLFLCSGVPPWTVHGGELQR